MLLFGSPLNHLGWLGPQAEESFLTATKNSSMPLMTGVAFIFYARRRSGLGRRRGGACQMDGACGSTIGSLQNSTPRAQALDGPAC